jgi:hypothetical protein
MFRFDSAHVNVHAAAAFFHRPWSDVVTTIMRAMMLAPPLARIITVVNGLGTRLNTKFSSINSALK